MKNEDYLKIANHNGFVLSEKAYKVIRVKDILGIGIRCPCCPNDRTRYCGSKKCVEEVNAKSTCHCGLFIKEN